MKKFLQEFKEFALRGNVLDMAIGVIVGGAFTGIVTSLTSSFINPLLSFILNDGDPGNLGDTGMKWTLGGAAGSFLTTVVNFFITALVLFSVLKAVNKLLSLTKKPEAPAAPTTKKCPYCFTEIDLKATRCPNCTSELKYDPAKK